MAELDSDTASESSVGSRLKPTRSDGYTNYHRLSITRFVRDRELGIRTMIPASLDIRYCYNISQWSERTWSTYENDLRYRMRSGCRGLKDIAVKTNLFVRDAVSSSKKRKVYRKHWYNIRRYTACRSSLLINVKVNKYTFLEVVLFNESTIALPVTAMGKFFANYRNKYLLFNTLAEYLYMCTSTDELLSCLLNTARLRETDDEDHDDGLFNEFLLNMWEVYVPSLRRDRS